MRDSTIFYRSYFEAISQLEAKDKLIIYEAIFDYSLNLIEPQLVGIPKTIFTLIKPTLDSCIKNYKNGSKPKRERSENEAKNKPSKSETEAYKDKDKDKDKDLDFDKDKYKGRFAPPTLEEVKIFCEQKGYRSEIGIRAYEGYDVAGWKDSQGKQIKNWKQKLIHVWFKPEHKMQERAETKKHLLSDGTPNEY